MSNSDSTNVALQFLLAQQERENKRKEDRKKQEHQKKPLSRDEKIAVRFFKDGIK